MELEQRLAELLDLAKAGNEIIISPDSTPVARLTAIIPPPSLHKRRIAGLHAGAMQISEDFDQPLPDEFWISAS